MLQSVWSIADIDLYQRMCGISVVVIANYDVIFLLSYFIAKYAPLDMEVVLKDVQSGDENIIQASLLQFIDKVKRPCSNSYVLLLKHVKSIVQHWPSCKCKDLYVCVLCTSVNNENYTMCHTLPDMYPHLSKCPHCKCTWNWSYSCIFTFHVQYYLSSILETTYMEWEAKLLHIPWIGACAICNPGYSQIFNVAHGNRVAC